MAKAKKYKNKRMRSKVCMIQQKTSLNLYLRV